MPQLIIFYVGKKINAPTKLKDKYRITNVDQIIRNLKMDGYSVRQQDSIKTTRSILKQIQTDQLKVNLVICENTIERASDGSLFLKEISGSNKTLLLHDTKSDPEGKSKFNIENNWWSNVPIAVCAAVEMLTQN